MTRNTIIDLVCFQKDKERRGRSFFLIISILHSGRHHVKVLFFSTRRELFCFFPKDRKRQEEEREKEMKFYNSSMIKTINNGAFGVYFEIGTGEKLIKS
jgi:hypothetical protein